MITLECSSCFRLFPNPSAFYEHICSGPNTQRVTQSLCTNPDADRRITDAGIAGTKHDQGKARMDLIPDDIELEEARVWGFGAAKYGDHNWRSGIKVSRLLAALKRHTNAIQRGEDVDPESGLLHAAHVRCNAAMLAWVIKNKPELDDRWKYEYKTKIEG